jgi:hypothetical protein
MAGEMRQSTSIKQTNEMYGESGSAWCARSEKTIMSDAVSIPAMVTTYEDSTVKTLRHGTQMVEGAFSTFDAAFKKMMLREIEVEAAVKAHTSKMKDKMGQLAEAIGKIEKLTGTDFETKLQRLERFANAVDTLDRLNKTGKLAEVAAALGKLGAP